VVIPRVIKFQNFFNWSGTIGILAHLMTDWQMNLSLKRIFAFALAIVVATNASASITLVEAGRLLEPRSGIVLSPAAVVIENGKIKEVGPARTSAASCVWRRQNGRSRRRYVVA